MILTRNLTALFGVLGITLGCASSALTVPLIAATGSAEASDGYEAALATAEANGYQVVARDRAYGHVRLRASSVLESPDHRPVYFDIHANHGFINVQVTVPSGPPLLDAQIRQMRRERSELAWSISKRARMLAGEPFGDAKGVDVLYAPALPLPPIVAIFPPPP